MNIAALQNLILKCDELLAAQIASIIHHPAFLQLEATWRSLHFLVNQTHAFNNKYAKIKVLNISWHELSRDLQRAADVEQSALFAKIYSHEFDLPGGEPFGLLIGDYQVTHRMRAGSLDNDITTLTFIAKIAASAFSPFISTVDPSFFGLDDFSGLGRPLNLEWIFEQQEYRDWRVLRESEDARFIGLLLPSVLLRKPYIHEHAVISPLQFSEEHCRYPLKEARLWGNPVYHFALNVIRAYTQSGWFAEIRGANVVNAGGVLTTIVHEHIATDKAGLMHKFSTSVCITEKQEKKLNDAGFIVFCSNTCSAKSAVYACPSIQLAKKYDKNNAAENARLSTMLNYILCISRFAHYIKIIARGKIGSFATPQDCEACLQNWLRNYTAANSDMSQELRARYPLREAKVEVHTKIGQPGAYWCTLHFAPHYQFDNAETYLQLSTELTRHY